MKNRWISWNRCDSIKALRDKKGYTYVELVTLIILIPSTLLLILPYIEQQVQNAKKDVHLSNARHYAGATHLALMDKEIMHTEGPTQILYITLADLIKQEYISKPEIQEKRYLIGKPISENQNIFQKYPPTLQSYVKIKNDLNNTRQFYVYL